MRRYAQTVTDSDEREAIQREIDDLAFQIQEQTLQLVTTNQQEDSHAEQSRKVIDEINKDPKNATKALGIKDVEVSANDRQTLEDGLGDESGVDQIKQSIGIKSAQPQIEPVPTKAEVGVPVDNKAKATIDTDTKMSIENAEKKDQQQTQRQIADATAAAAENSKAAIAVQNTSQTTNYVNQAKSASQASKSGIDFNTMDSY